MDALFYSSFQSSPGVVCFHPCGPVSVSGTFQASVPPLRSLLQVDGIFPFSLKIYLPPFPLAARQLVGQFVRSSLRFLAH